jgi:hypothetical protein
MEVAYYIIIPQFNKFNDGLSYLSTHSYQFAFAIGSVVYDYDGNRTSAPENSEFFQIDELAMDIKEYSEYLSPGETYVKDGFIQYFKEIRI